MGRFRDALARPGLATIAEVKRRSPSAGDLHPDADPARLAAAFAGAGAAGISVLVDEAFGGTLDDLRAARAATDAPLLAKGFFRELPQLKKLRAAGADCVLLILRDLDDGRAAQLMTYARALGLDTLVEAHDGEELALAVALGADPIGINARDLSTLDVDRGVFARLAPRIPPGIIKIAESGVRGPHDLLQYAAAGADAVLVGESLVTDKDPRAAVADLVTAGSHPALRGDRK